MKKNILVFLAFLFVINTCHVTISGDDKQSNKFQWIVLNLVAILIGTGGYYAAYRLYSSTHKALEDHNTCLANLFKQKDTLLQQGKYDPKNLDLKKIEDEFIACIFKNRNIER